jgi:hypothetical protein
LQVYDTVKFSYTFTLCVHQLIWLGLSTSSIYPSFMITTFKILSCSYFKLCYMIWLIKITICILEHQHLVILFGYDFVPVKQSPLFSSSVILPLLLVTTMLMWRSGCVLLQSNSMLYRTVAFRLCLATYDFIL